MKTEDEKLQEALQIALNEMSNAKEDRKVHKGTLDQDVDGMGIIADVTVDGNPIEMNKTFFQRQQEVCQAKRLELPWYF